SPGVMMGMEKIPVAFDCWLDFYDVLSEGIMMPLGALLMSLLIGWKFGIGLIEEEVALTPGKKLRAPFLTDMCFKFIVPIILLVVLYAQLQDFGLI
ncbi:MAG: sodium-dependent transporter, partial [Pyramidobacter sp.]|nr:sodium-dependent transporter [Pyramidobacter sp.]